MIDVGDTRTAREPFSLRVTLKYSSAPTPQLKSTGRCTPFARIAILFLANRVNLIYHPAANTIGSTEQKLGMRTNAEPRLRCFCLSASSMRPCLRDCLFWSVAVRALASSRQIAADAIARNYDAVEEGSELLLIAIRCSGSFAQPAGGEREAYLRALLIILFIYSWARYSAVGSPYPGLSCPIIRLAGMRGDFKRKGSAYVQMSAASCKSNRARRTRQGFDQR
ncbi:hypothetical protein QA640_44225 (plasmid) [Bradyrhizobium sp. CB82]|uniref:hypothetical protein n=1 Tax=Bradyrhizobium sp. CB82 TaxID=3039159 RepID=UPI0024B16899|nr:hypothetical protein [Bradyrhizobium sp. CB82]WFU45833.1 hypothetical protein QA640_44225 [Bradyrhizobium sp. CB82]